MRERDRERHHQKHEEEKNEKGKLPIFLKYYFFFFISMGIMVIVHELGHYLTAISLGVPAKFGWDSSSPILTIGSVTRAQFQAISIAGNWAMFWAGVASIPISFLFMFTKYRNIQMFFLVLTVVGVGSFFIFAMFGYWS